MKYLTLWIVPLSLLVLGITVGSADSSPTKTIPSGAVAYTAPKGWVKETPSSRMRKDQFRLPGPKGVEDGEMVVFFFPGTGGSVDANLQRWYGQFRNADGSKITKPEAKSATDVKGLSVTIVSLRGTYLKSKAPMMGGPKEEKKGYALWAAIAETQEGPWFFKAVGPEATVKNWQASFDAFVQSFRPAGK